MAKKKVIASAITALILLRRKRRRNSKNRKTWVKPFIQSRPENGAYVNLVQEFLTDSPEDFRRFLRLDKTAFDEIVTRIEADIRKQDTTFRPSIAPEERLAITLRFLATGESFASLSFMYRVGERTISGIVIETCTAIYNALKGEYMKIPNTSEEWKNVASQFHQCWNFPNCIGAIDGKHVRIQPPGNSGSMYHNYKHTFSIVLLGLVDADYKFLYVDVGCNGRSADGGVFSNSTLFHALNMKMLNIPDPTPLHSNSSKELPYVIVGDDAFPLRNDLMKPYSKRQLSRDERVFNYRLSRARRVVENAFGILANRFRVLLNPIALSPEKVEVIVLCACALHNFLRSHKTAKAVYVPPGFLDSENPSTSEVVPGKWRTMPNLPKATLPKTTNQLYSAKEQRDLLRDHFSSKEGSVHWQNSIV